MTRRLFISLFLTLGAVFAALAQTSVDMSLPRNARVGSPFTISINVVNPEGNVATPSAPDLEGCTFRGGPAVSTSVSRQIINGRSSSSTIKAYTFTYTCDAERTVKVPSVTVNIGGKEFSTQPGQFAVSAARGGNRGGFPAGMPDPFGDPFSDPFFDDFFEDFGQPSAPVANEDFRTGADELYMRVEVNKSTVYEQEPVEVAIKLYASRQQVENLMAQGAHVFDGCLIEPYPAVTTLSWTPTKGPKGPMYSAVVYRALLYPQRAGEISLKGDDYTATVVRQVMVQDLMGYRPYMQNTQVNLTPRPATITVKPLPEPKPADFSGAVGRFKANGELIGNKFRTNEAGTVVYTFEGTGNIKYFTAPAVTFPDEFEAYEPNVTTDARISGGNTTGSQRVEYTFVPQAVGKFHIDEYRFVYFDPAANAYKTEIVPGFDLDVEQGAAVSSSTASSKLDVKPKNTDIHHIKVGADKPAKQPSYLSTSKLYWAIYPVLIVLFAAGCYLYFRMRRADIKGRRLKGAGKVARKRLSKAGKFLRAHNYDAFYEELLRALQSYLSDKFQIPASQLNRDKIQETIAERGGDDELREQIINILNDCEMARYTPQSSGAAEMTYEHARQAIDSIEHLKS